MQRKGVSSMEYFDYMVGVIDGLLILGIVICVVAAIMRLGSDD